MDRVGCDVVIEGKRVQTFSPKVRDVYTKDDRIPVVANSVIFRNMGTTMLYLEDNLTIRPGGDFAFGSQNDINLIIHEFHIKFGGVTEVPGEIAVNRCEVVEMQLNNADLAHFISKGP